MRIARSALAPLLVVLCATACTREKTSVTPGAPDTGASGTTAAGLVLAPDIPERLRAAGVGQAAWIDASLGSEAVGKAVAAKLKLEGGVRAEAPERDPRDDQPASLIGMIR